MKMISLALSLLLAAPLALAHEGHSHGPDHVEALHGGILKEGKTLNLELVTEGSTIKIYPISMEGKLLPVKDVKVMATAQPPKKNKVAVSLEASGDHYKGKVDTKGHRRVELKIDATTGEKKESFVYQIEPEG